MATGVLGCRDVRAVAVYIYALTAPDGSVRYIGKSHAPQYRLQQHFYETTPVSEWLHGLFARGESSRVVCLETISPGEDADAGERHQLLVHRRAGCDLLNSWSVAEGEEAIAIWLQLARAIDVSGLSGPESLRKKLAARGAMALLAHRYGIQSSVVSRWVSGRRVPNTKLMARLEDDLGIHWKSWVQERAA
jgi:hypothetical protein